MKVKDDTSFSIPELCEHSSLRNSRRAIILAGEQGRDKLGDTLGDKLGGKLETSWKTSWETSWETKETTP